MPSVSLVRREESTESEGRSGSASSIATGAGAMEEGAASRSAEAGAGLVAFGGAAESAPSRAGPDPANAGPGVIGTRAGAMVRRDASVVISAELVPAAG